MSDVRIDDSHWDVLQGAQLHFLPKLCALDRKSRMSRTSFREALLEAREKNKLIEKMSKNSVVMLLKGDAFSHQTLRGIVIAWRQSVGGQFGSSETLDESDIVSAVFAATEQGVEMLKKHQGALVGADGPLTAELIDEILRGRRVHAHLGASIVEALHRRGVKQSHRELFTTDTDVGKRKAVGDMPKDRRRLLPIKRMQVAPEAWRDWSI
jgi:hypothetical protein